MIADPITKALTPKLKCGSCGEVTQKETCVTLSEAVPLPSGKGTANLVQKCKICGREGTVQMMGGHGQPLTHGAAESGKYMPLMVFDCRGMEPVEFFFGNGWEAYAVWTRVVPNLLHQGQIIVSHSVDYILEFNNEPLLSGTKFIEIDLSDGDFAEYDEEGKYPVGISNLQSRFVVGKPKGRTPAR
ncbi:hypothetical protein ACLOJK_040017 [Asimina triloba]